MINVPFNVGTYITNGASAGRVTELVERDPRWKTDGVRVSNIGLELFGGNVGQTSFVPGYLLGSWAEIPFEWAPVKGSDDLVERYVWRDNWRRLEREVQRRDEVTS